MRAGPVRAALPSPPVSLHGPPALADDQTGMGGADGSGSGVRARHASESNVSREKARADDSRETSPSFPDAEVAEDHIEDVLHIDPPRDSAEPPGRHSQLFGHEIFLTP